RARRHELFFFRRQKQEALWQREEPAQHVDVNERVFFGRRDEHRPIGDDWQTEVRVAVPIRPEQDASVARAVAPQVVEELGRLWPVLPEPLFLLFWSRAIREHAIAEVH